MEGFSMRAFLKDVLGLITQYSIEIVLWLVVLTVIIATWYVLWPIQESAIAGAITVACIGAVASAQSTIVALIRTTKRPKPKKK